jgi:hypothetical protein
VRCGRRPMKKIIELLNNLSKKREKESRRNLKKNPHDNKGYYDKLKKIQTV